MRKRILRMSPPLLAALLLFSCKSGEELDPSIEKLGRASGPVAPSQRSAPPPVRDDGPSAEEVQVVHEGVVLERIHVPNYTYLRLSLTDGREAWAAIPKTEIEVGAKARVVESLVMHKFKSPSLGRTFETIIFGTLDDGAVVARDAGPNDDDVGAVREPSLPPGHPPI
jgi:hypothetical protein